MAISDVLKIGNKIDIKFLNQNTDKIYKSSIFGYVSPTEMEITMPTDEGKMVLFQNGTACEFLFYTGNGLYTCETVVTNRYKKEGFYLLLVRITSVPKKFQRREHFRVSYLHDFLYFKISKEVAEMEKTSDLVNEVSKTDYILERYVGTLKDISGGGIRFITDNELEIDSYILSVIRLGETQTYYLATRIIACEPAPQVRNKFIVRARFEYKNNDDQEAIIRFAFEEDRRIRKKENW
uniref:flagellar brake protein n=1 Tax=Agathobacter sp. TaxID=2021311 RepID=UPI004056525A